VLQAACCRREDIDYYLMHQATYKMMAYLFDRLELDEERIPIVLEDCGNTISSTIPIVIDRLRGADKLRPGVRSMLVGFGVGWSWAGCVWDETWAG
jgi:3-oxoacyl-[acyl-carrier-protein] synthase-3